MSNNFVGQNDFSMQLISVLDDIRQNNGKVKEILNNNDLVKVMSKISNYIRYDLISKTEVVTYKIPSVIENEMDTFLF
jgi:hypothetical protein